MGIWIARDGKSYGPYEDQQVQQWVSGGTISVEDLAIRDGDSDWVPLKQILSTTPSSPDDWINGFSTRKSDSTQVPPYASRGSMGPLGNARRRASQLPESTRASYLYAGFWLRLVAYLVDLVIVMLSSLVLGFLAGLALAGHLNNNDLRLTGFAIGLIWGWLYFAVCESSSWQGTPGKLALGLVVTDLSGKRIGFGRATGRYLGKIISGGILLIGYLMAGWTVRRQALHDLMAGAYVVRKKGLLAFENLEASHDAEVAPRMSAGAIVGMVLAVLFVLVIAPVLAAIAIPAYQSYVIRSQVAEGEVLADSAKTALVEYYENKGEFPGNNSLAGLASAGSINGKYVTSVDANHGRILVTYGNTASDKISGNHLVLVPTPDGGSVSWKCGSPELKVSYLPQDCRSDVAQFTDASSLEASTPTPTPAAVSPSEEKDIERNAKMAPDGNGVQGLLDLDGQTCNAIVSAYPDTFQPADNEMLRKNLTTLPHDFVCEVAAKLVIENSPSWQANLSTADQKALSAAVESGFADLENQSANDQPASTAIRADDDIDRGKYGAGEAQLTMLNQKIEDYALDGGSPPLQLEDLVTKPTNSSNWHGPYVKHSDLIDPWGHEFGYKYPGQHGSFDLIFYGQDGVSGGAGYKKDVGNWE